MSVNCPVRPPNGMGWSVRPIAKNGWLRIPGIGRRGCSRATPQDKAVGCISSRARTASIILSASHSIPVLLASWTIWVITESRVRAGRGTRIAWGDSSSCTDIASAVEPAARSNTSSTLDSSSSSSAAPILSSSQWWISPREKRHFPATLRPGSLPRSAIRDTCLGNRCK